MLGGFWKTLEWTDRLKIRLWTNFFSGKRVQLQPTTAISTSINIEIKKFGKIQRLVFYAWRIRWDVMCCTLRHIFFVTGEDQMTLDNEQRIWKVVKNRAWLEYNIHWQHGKIVQFSGRFTWLLFDRRRFHYCLYSRRLNTYSQINIKPSRRFYNHATLTTSMHLHTYAVITVYTV